MLDGFHAYGHSKLCSSQNGQYCVAGAGNANGSGVEVTNRALNLYRRITADMDPHKQHLQFSLIASGQNIRLNDNCVARLRADAHRNMRQFFQYTDELAALMARWGFTEDAVPSWAIAMIDDAAGQCSRVHTERVDYDKLALLCFRDRGLAAHSAQTPETAKDIMCQRQLLRKINLGALIHQHEELDKKSRLTIHKMWAKVQEEKFILDARLSAKPGCTDVDHTHSLKTAEDKLPFTMLQEIAPLLHAAYLEWHSAYMLLTEASPTSNVEKNRRRRQTRRAKQAYERLIHIHNAWLAHANELKQQDAEESQAGFEFLPLAEYTHADFEGNFPPAYNALAGSDATGVPRFVQDKAVNYTRRYDRIREQFVVLEQQVKNLKDVLDYRLEHFRTLSGNLRQSFDTWGEAKIAEFELKRTEQLRDQWNSTFLHWSCFQPGEGDDSDAESDADCGPDDGDDSDTVTETDSAAYDSEFDLT